MKTTLNIDDTVMQRLREEAARQGKSMGALVEAGLRRILAESLQESGHLPELPTLASGGMRVDVADRDRLYKIMEDR
ncbi:hypothetical protein [Aquisalimonas sp.]|uniref:FitA-like ribbon-helix-helix domain-containing protein n=1 Tax=Aquisalimonas sp. TaxID=1872621 RepID=UPI0025BFDDFF|nr:hypothetical protein [Aquisalimonas sp.]